MVVVVGLLELAVATVIVWMCRSEVLVEDPSGRTAEVAVSKESPFVGWGASEIDGEELSSCRTLTGCRSTAATPRTK
jgi:hypothetical protein